MLSPKDIEFCVSNIDFTNFFRLIGYLFYLTNITLFVILTFKFYIEKYWEVSEMPRGVCSESVRSIRSSAAHDVFQLNAYILTIFLLLVILFSSQSSAFECIFKLKDSVATAIVLLLLRLEKRI